MTINIESKKMSSFQQQAKFSLSSKSLVHPGSTDKKTFLNLQLNQGPQQLRRPKTLLANGFIIPRLPSNGLINKSTPNLLSESFNNHQGKD